MSENLSLFGWPIPEPREVAGRPDHVPSDEIRLKIMMLLALKKPQKEIAAAVGLSEKTIRRHYSRELSQRRVARLQLDATIFAALYEKMLAGDVSAIKELVKRLEKHDLAEMSANFGADTSRRRESRESATPRRGKKEQAQLDAETAHEGSEWGDDLLPGSGVVN